MCQVHIYFKDYDTSTICKFLSCWVFPFQGFLTMFTLLPLEGPLNSAQIALKKTPKKCIQTISAFGYDDFWPPTCTWSLTKYLPQRWNEDSWRHIGAA